MSLFSLFPSDLAFTWITIMLLSSALCFLVSEITGNYSQVDKLWSILPAIYSWVSYVLFPSARLLLMAILVTLWGARLTFNFARKGGYSAIPWKGEEDYRWSYMRSQPALMGRFRFGLFNLFFISLYQNFLIMLFTTPALVAASFPGKELSLTDLAAAIFMAGFLIVETVADNQQFLFHQLKKGKKVVPGKYTLSLKNGFLSEGLWKYSRHPNFLGEQGIWLSFYFFGVAASGEWINITLSGPVLLIMLFAGSTWLTEKITAAKYPEYQSYQKQVSRFLSIPLISRR